MGKRRNKKNNRLNNLCSEKKPIALSEQNDTKVVQHHTPKNINHQPVLNSKKIEDENFRKSELEKSSNIKIYSSNEKTHLNSSLSKFSPSKLASNTSDYGEKDSFPVNKNHHTSDMFVKANDKFNSADSKPGKEGINFVSPHLNHMPDTDEEYISYTYSKPAFDGSVKMKVSDMTRMKANYKFKNLDSNPGKKGITLASTHSSHKPDIEDEFTSCDTISNPGFGNSVKVRELNQVICKKKSHIEENLFTSVNDYNSSKDLFSRTYKRWLPERKKTLDALQTLVEEVLSAQKQYNTTQANCKELSFEMRKSVIQSESAAGYFFSTLGGFIFDAVSGISSFSQAFSIDSFQTKFQELMEHDAEITKELYETRSRCVSRYEGIEEVMRKFHADTFSSTIGKISSTLEVGKYWESMKSAYKRDDMETLLNTVGKFLNNACQSEVLSEVGYALDQYANDNPAALEACKSTGKAAYGAVNTWAPNLNRYGTLGKINCAANCYLMLEDIKDVDRFRRDADDDCQGSKLVMQIEDAMDSLQSELKEMNDIYRDVLKTERCRIKYDFE